MDNLPIGEKLDTAPRPSSRTERRRLGRVVYENKALIALLRDPAAEVAGDALAMDGGDALAPARGMLAGLLISVLLWCVIGLIVWYFVG